MCLGDRVFVNHAEILNHHCMAAVAAQLQTVIVDQAAEQRAPPPAHEANSTQPHWAAMYCQPAGARPFSAAWGRATDAGD